MGFRFPQEQRGSNRNDREQVFIDARQELSEADAELQVEAEAFGEAKQAESEADEQERREADAVERFAEVQRELTAAERSSHAEP
jgi:multidrug efflux pump subunit AcrA (membrane-fusion protein)